VRVITVDPSRPREDRLREAAQVLEAGGVVAQPTETVYGLSVDAFNPEALKGLNRLKRKPEDSPALLLLSGPEQVSQVSEGPSALFHELVGLYWPGPLTLIIPAGPALPPEVGGGRGTVAVRVPGMALPRRLATQLGRPITGVSANLHAEPPCRTAAEVARAFPEGIELILDGGPTPGGLASTIVDLAGKRPRVVREGLVPVSSLRSFLPELSVASP
jgi:L-threonylcarbamoyladenylate synthase